MIVTQDIARSNQPRRGDMIVTENSEKETNPEGVI
jgi:hypothetical protein